MTPEVYVPGIRHERYSLPYQAVALSKEELGVLCGMRCGQKGFRSGWKKVLSELL